MPDNHMMRFTSYVPPGYVLLIAPPAATSREAVRSVLARRGHTVEFNSSANSAVDSSGDLDRYDLLILELDTVDEEAVQVCARLRAVTFAPLMVLVPETARSQGIRALELGADTFIVTPFDRREIVARSEALVRRYRRLWFVPLPA